MVGDSLWQSGQSCTDLCLCKNLGPPVGLSRNDLLNNSIFANRRKFSRMATIMVFPLQFDFLKIPNHSRPPDANLGCNFSILKIKKKQKK